MTRKLSGEPPTRSPNATRSNTSTRTVLPPSAIETGDTRTGSVPACTGAAPSTTDADPGLGNVTAGGVYDGNGTETVLRSVTPGPFVFGHT